MARPGHRSCNNVQRSILAGCPIYEMTGSLMAWRTKMIAKSKVRIPFLRQREKIKHFLVIEPQLGKKC